MALWVSFKSERRHFPWLPNSSKIRNKIGAEKSLTFLSR